MVLFLTYTAANIVRKLTERIFGYIYIFEARVQSKDSPKFSYNSIEIRFDLEVYIKVKDGVGR